MPALAPAAIRTSPSRARGSGPEDHGKHPAKTLDLWGAALTGAVSLSWGASPVAVKIGLLDAPAMWLGSMRLFIGGVVILFWAWVTGRGRPLLPSAAEFPTVAAVTLLFATQVSLMNIGMASTSASHAAIALNLYAVHTMILAHFLIPGDRLTVARLAGVLVGYAGIVLLLARGNDAGRASLYGDSLVFLSGACLALRTVYLARAVQRVEPVKLLLAQSLIGALLLGGAEAISGSRSVEWTLPLLVSLAYQGIVVAGFNSVANLWLLQRYRPSELALFFLAEPIVGVLAAALALGEPLTIDVLMAGAAVAVGAGLSRAGGVTAFLGGLRRQSRAGGFVARCE